MDQRHRSVAGSIHRIASLAGVVAAVLWLVSATPAHAATVSYFLDQSNRLQDGTNYLQVTIDDEGAAGAINFSIQTLAPLTDLVSYQFGNLRFGFNGVELDKNNIVGLPDGWKIKHDKTLDGFGQFENVLIGKKWNAEDPLSFSIVGIDGDSIYSYAGSHDGGDGVFFASFLDGLEGVKHRGHGDWYGEWYANNCHRCTRGAYFIGGGEQIAPVPVPGAVWLFGSGIVGMLGLARRRRTSDSV